MSAPAVSRGTTPRLAVVRPVTVLDDVLLELVDVGDNIRVDPGRRERDRAYREAHRDRIRAYHAARYQRERAQRAIQDRARRLKHPEAARERSRRWRLAHPERARAHRQRWLDDVPDREAAARCARTANRRARMYGVDGQIGYETVLEIWRIEPHCIDCGEGRGLDHVIPLSRGGSNTSGNLANRCHSCNARKGTKAA